MIIYTILALISGVLILYHHIGWPLLLRKLSQGKTPPKPSKAEDFFPLVSIIIPAHNEAAVIEDKLWNLITIDYPSNRVNFVIICDGCSDNTVDIARSTIDNVAFDDVDISLEILEENIGKTAILNRYIPQAKGAIIGLSDCSALLSSDCLRICAQHFYNLKIGVVCSSYHIFNHGSQGEATYWQYQRRIKQSEAKIGDAIGAHGAFYLFMKQYFKPIANDTINDDFIIPMNIVAQGHRAIYEPEIVAIELECANDSMDWNRRKRIAAGNIQQALRLFNLLHPKHKMTALSFASGKFLRAIMPFILLIFFITTGLLAMEYILVLAIVFIPQLLVYLLAIYSCIFTTQNKILKTIHYLVVGHFAGLIGSLRYLIGLETGQWKRA